MSEAAAAVKKGDEIVSKWVYFGDRYVDAIDFYTKGANLYKLEKDLDKAGEAYEKVVSCCFKMDQKFDVNKKY
jgi:hypothetical protein